MTAATRPRPRRRPSAPAASGRSRWPTARRPASSTPRSATRAATPRTPATRTSARGRTGHAEVTQVTFDPDQVSYEELVAKFWAVHDPTQLNRQGPDVGDQYRTAIFTHSDEQAEIARRSLEQAQEQLQAADRDHDRARDRLQPRRGVPPVLPREAPVGWRPAAVADEPLGLARRCQREEYTTSISRSPTLSGRSPFTSSCSGRWAGRRAPGIRPSRGTVEVDLTSIMEATTCATGSGCGRPMGALTTTTASASSTSPSRSTRDQEVDDGGTRAAWRTVRAFSFPAEEDRDVPGYYALFVFDPDGIRVELTPWPR